MSGTVVTEMAALHDDLARRFRVATAQVTLGGRTIELLHPASADDLISEEDYVRDERLPYWADQWPSGLVLAAHLVTKRGEGARLLELGCGTGLVATAAVLAGFDVTATDYYEDACLFTRWNAWHNTGVAIAAPPLDWRTYPDNLRRYDMVVASDVLYEPRYPEMVAAMFSRSLAPGGSALVADPGRVALPAFLAACAARGLVAEPPLVVPWDSGEQHQQISIFTIRHA